MKNKLLYHIIIDLCMLSGILFLNELSQRRKEIKKFNKKLDETQSSIQGLELSVELIEQRLSDNPNYLKH